MDLLIYVVMTILPVFLIIGVGCVAFKREIIPHNGHKSLAAFVFNFGFPAAIFGALCSKPLEQIWNTDYVIAYTLSSSLAFGLVAVILASMPSSDKRTTWEVCAQQCYYRPLCK